MNKEQAGIKEELLGEYKLVIENWSIGNEKPVTMFSIKTLDNKYVGTLEGAQKLFDKGILPETYEDRNVASIGKSIIDGKWYGWSHRAMYGFQIGDVVKEGDCTASSGWTKEYLKENPSKDLSLPIGFEAKTEEDTKRMAIAFADSVS